MFLIGAAIYTLDLVASFPKDPASNDVSYGQILQAVDVPSAIDGDRFDFSTRLEEIAEQLPHLLRAWFNRTEELEVVMNAFKEVLLNDGAYEESLFLRVVQVLEHFHGVIFPGKNRNRYLDPKNWKSFTDCVRPNLAQALEDVGCSDDDIKEILSKRIGSLNEFSFMSRLKNLINEIPGPELMPMLNNPADKDRGIDDFVRKIDKTRNFLIHHEQKHAKEALTGRQLRGAISSCWAILSYWLARSLGFSERMAGDIAYKAHYAIFRVGRKSAL
jgi:hypothetical protein